MRRAAAVYAKSDQASGNFMGGYMKLRDLVGSGDKIGLFVLPFLVVGVTLNILFPSVFGVGGPPSVLRAVSIAVLTVGVVAWLWTVVLILVLIPRRKLITGGPFAVVRHPLYTGVSFLVLPWLGFLLNSWLGVVIGIVLYLASRRFEPEEETNLARSFGAAWEDYRRKVWIPWL
jgi:protein-S-isoprenylcysteine O-methyltransferase Ste14